MDTEYIRAEPVKYDNDGAMKEHFDKVASKVTKALEKRRPLEEKWRTHVKMYNARLERPDTHTEFDSQVDMPISRKIGGQAVAQLIGDHQGPDPTFVIAAVDDIETEAVNNIRLISEECERRMDILDAMDNDARFALVFPASVVKVVRRVKTKDVRFWQTVEEEVYDEVGEPVMDMGASGVEVQAMVQKRAPQTKTVVVEDRIVAAPYSPEDLITPLPCPSIENSPWICIRYYLYPEQMVALATPDEDGERAFNLVEVEKIEEIKKTEGKGPDQKLKLKYGAGETEIDTKDLREIWEIYERVDGEEHILHMDAVTKTPLGAVINPAFEDARPIFTFSWNQVVNDIYGQSLFELMEPVHRAYTASTNQRLDSATKALQKLLIGLKGSGLKDALKNGLVGGYFEANSPEALKELREFSLSDQYTQLPEFEARCEAMLHDVSHVSLMQFGHEPAQRPTAKGTTTLLKKSEKPLMILFDRYCRHWEKIWRCVLGLMHQHNPDGVQIRDGGVLRTVHWPEEYWGDLVTIKTNATSSVILRDLRKEEMLAALDKAQEIIQNILGMAQQISEAPPPLALVSSQLLNLYSRLAIEFFAEFEIDYGEMLDVGQSLAVGKQIQQVIEQLSQQVQSLQQQLDQVTGQAAGMDQGHGMGPGGPGEASAQPGLGPGAGPPPGVPGVGPGGPPAFGGM